MFTTLSALGLVILGQICKKYITPKYGATGLHVFLFALACVIVVVHSAMTIYPSFGAIVLKAGEYTVSAIALYEVILKKILDQVSS